MSSAGRILSLDVGRRRIGLALSDELRVTTRGLPTLERTTLRRDLDHLEALCREQGVALLLVGEPKHMTGEASTQGDYVRLFAARLAERTQLPLTLQDERLTSWEAERRLSEQGVRLGAHNKAQVDQMAAILILEDYLHAWSSATPSVEEGLCDA